MPALYVPRLLLPEYARNQDVVSAFVDRVSDALSSYTPFGPPLSKLTLKSQAGGWRAGSALKSACGSSSLLLSPTLDGSQVPVTTAPGELMPLQRGSEYLVLIRHEA